MSRVFRPGATSKNRRPGIVPTTLSLTREAHALLRQLAPTSKAHGHFVSSLITQYAARREVTEQLREVLRVEGVLDHYGE